MSIRALSNNLNRAMNGNEREELREGDRLMNRLNRPQFMQESAEPGRVRAEPRVRAQPAASSTTGSGVGRRILLIDDDPSVRDSLGGVLEGEHYTVEAACDGAEAVRKFATWHPDLVLLDLNMPRLDGWAAFQQMEREHPFVPVIVITARPHQYDRAAGIGIDAFMEKPLNVAVLLRTIRRLLRESESQRVARLTDRGFITEDLNVEAARSNHA